MERSRSCLGTKTIKVGLIVRRSAIRYRKSFISEHTAEYVLVPNLKSILCKEFNTVTPIFPWATREGSTISRHLHKGERFKVIGMYPRRPKLTGSDPYITVKLNRQIFVGAQCGMEFGIPIIAGCPLVRDFWELGNIPVCLWLKLDQFSNDDVQLDIEQIQPYSITNQMSKFLFSNDEALLSYLTERAKLMDFDIALSAFGNIKLSSRDLEFFSFFKSMGGYRPVYFLLK